MSAPSGQTNPCKISVAPRRSEPASPLSGPPGATLFLRPARSVRALFARYECHLGEVGMETLLGVTPDTVLNSCLSGPADHSASLFRSCA